MAKAKATVTLTKNLGNFESLKIEIGLEEVEFLPDEKAPAAIDRVYALVERKLEEKMAQAIKDLKG